MNRKAAALLALTVGIAGLSFAGGKKAADTAPVSGGVVNLYSARHYETDNALYAMFEERNRRV
ncbi:MAG: hypothetical protein LBD37_09055 [Treponema sp.]|nr:hypothetical protein [Treponema sp.]